MISPDQSGFLYPEPQQPTIGLRYAHWESPHPNRGTVVLQGGRTEFYEKYAETIAHLLDRGFQVWSMDWRGQGLSARLLPERHKGYIDGYDTYLKDLHFFLQSKVLPSAPRPLILMGHSMGGHLALRYMREHQGLFAAAALSAPMIAIQSAPFPDPIFRGLTAAGCRLGMRTWYAPGQHDFNAEDRDFSNNRITSCPIRFQKILDCIQNNPDLALGGATFGWLYESIKSMAILRQRSYASQIIDPVLIVSATDEKIVSPQAQVELAHWMPQCRLVSISGCEHELLQEVDVVQTLFWEAFDAFLEDHLSAERD